MTSLRLRYENVDQDGVIAGKSKNPDEADAWTLRSFIGWQTRPFSNFSIAAQLINITQFNDNFFDESNVENRTDGQRYNFRWVHHF